MQNSQGTNAQQVGLLTRAVTKVLCEIQARLLFSKYSAIPTHMTNREKLTLYNIVRSNQPAVAVEIGSYIGASANFIAKALPPAGKLYCIDTWQNQANGEAERDTYNEFKSNTQDWQAKIIEVRGFSHEVADQIPAGTIVDFLFIDGDHSYESCLRDWMTYKRFLQKGSIVAFHDTMWHEGVTRAVSEIAPRNLDSVVQLPNLGVYRVIR